MPRHEVDIRPLFAYKNQMLYLASSCIVKHWHARYRSRDLVSQPIGAPVRRTNSRLIPFLIGSSHARGEIHAANAAHTAPFFFCQS